LLIYLLSTPVAPQLQKTFHVDGSASHVLLDGPLAYLGSTPQGTGKLTVLDLSNRDQFVQLGMVKTIGRLEAVIDGYAYFFEQFINDQYAWQYDLNIYDARNPAQIGFLKTIDLESYGGELFDIVVLDNFAYAIIGSSLQIFDVSDPANPAARGNLPGVENGVALAIAPGASDPGRLLAYVASPSSDHDLQILDVSDPMAPTAISTFATPQNSSKDIAVEGDYAYLLFDATVLAKIDIRNPELPLYIPETGSSTGFGSGESVMLAGDYAYLAYGYDGLEVKDLAGLGTRAFYRTPTSVGELAVTDSFALLAAGPAGFYFVWAGPESSAQIPAASGGTLISLYDGTQVGFSAGAFSEDTSVYHWPRYLPLVPQPDPPSQLIGPAFQLIAANNLQTQLPYTLMVPLGSVEGLDIIETSPALYWWEGSSWLPLANSNLDLQNGLVTAEASQLGTFAIIGELQAQQACYLPIIAR
jgi:hypothetical protein